MRILVVEDDKHIRRILESLLAKDPALQPHSPEVVLATDGEQGLKLLENGPYDLVITDLLMPRIDGFQFCRELRKHRFGAKVALIVTSAIYKDVATQLRLKKEVGDHQFFAKPYEMRDLVDAVRRIFDGGRRKEPPPIPIAAAAVEVAAAPSESGTLEATALPRLLLDLASRRASGTLSLERGKAKKALGLANGVLTSCESNLRTETLGHFLVSRGILDETQHQEALTRAQAQKERLGQALVELGWISEKDLWQQLAAQMRAKITSTLRWRDGSWSFTPGAQPPTRLQTPIDAAKLVFIGLQKTAHVDEIAQLLATVHGRVGLTPRAERHRETFARVFGPLGLEALASRPLIEDLMAGTDPTAMLVQLDALLLCGLADLEPAEVAQRGPEEPTNPVALERIISPAAPAPPPRNNLYDDLLGEEPSEVKPLPLKAGVETLRKQILTEYMALSTRNHYQVLGVAPDASFEQIAAAHAAQLERFRLERFADAELGADYAHVDDLHQAFARAFDTIGTPELRADYDRNLAAHRPPSRAPIDAELLAKQADALLRNGDAARARAKLAEAVAAAPDEASYHARLGWASFLAAGGSATQAPREALNDAWPSLEQALALDGDDADAHQFAGRVAAAAGDDDRAIPHLGRALDAQPTQAEALAAFEAACARKGSWRLLERRYRTIIHRLGNGRDPLRVSLWARLAELYATRLDDPESARVSREVLAKLGGAAPPPPPPTAPPGARFREQLAAERWDAALITAAVTANDAEAAEYYRRYRPRFLQRVAPIDPAQLLALRHPDDDAGLSRVLALVCAAQPPTFGLGDLGVSDDDLVPAELLPTPFARVAAHAAGFLGVEPPLIYRRGDFGAEVSVGGTQPPVLLSGPQALALSDRAALAFRLGRALSSLLPQRCAAATLPARQLKESLLAALLLVSPNLRVEDPDGNAGRLREKLAAGSPHLARELTPLVEKLLKSGTLNLSRFTRGLQRTAERIGLLLCGDPAVALRLVQDADAAAELTIWALGDEHLALREQLGLSVAV